MLLRWTLQRLQLALDEDDGLQFQLPKHMPATY